MWPIVIRVSVGTILWLGYFSLNRMIHFVPCNVAAWITPASTVALLGYVTLMTFRRARRHGEQTTLENLTDDLTQGHPDSHRSVGEAWDRPTTP